MGELSGVEAEVAMSVPQSRIVEAGANKPPLESEQISFDVERYGRERHTFIIQGRDFRAGGFDGLFQKPPNDQEIVLTDGCMDRDGNVYWVNDKEILPPDLWKEAVGSIPVSIFEYDPNLRRLFVESSDLPESRAIVELARNSGLDGNTDLTVNRLRSISKIGSGARNNVFIGKLSDWNPDVKKFIPDGELDKKPGYEKVSVERSADKVNELYKLAGEKGKYLIIRTVGLPAEPAGLSSASLLAPGHTELFDARAGDYDKGALIYEISEESAKACFNQDAGTWIFSKKDAPPLLPDQERIDTGGDFYIYHKKSAEPVTLGNLHNYAVLSASEAGRYYSEVVFDSNNPDCKLVGVVNPYGVWGWSKIAYRNGALEFMSIPEFDQKTKSNFRTFPKLSNI